MDITLRTHGIIEGKSLALGQKSVELANVELAENFMDEKGLVEG